MSNTTNKSLEKPAHNTDIDSWDVPVNSNSDIIDSCLGDVNEINLTGLSTYTLVTADLQCATLRFTGTLNSGAVTVKMTNGISASFNIVNATSQTDSTSFLTFGFTSGGNTYIVPQGTNQPIYFDGITPVVAPNAKTATHTIATISITGVATGSYSLTAQQAACDVIDFTGVFGAISAVGYKSPSGFVGSWDIILEFTNGTGNPFTIYASDGSTNVGVLTAGKNYRVCVLGSSSIKLIAGPT